MKFTLIGELKQTEDQKWVQGEKFKKSMQINLSRFQAHKFIKEWIQFDPSFIL